MSNFKITYNYPWLLLLIIPAVLLALIPYFRLDKRYRFTRNRIISIASHIIASVLVVNLIAGLGFSYEIPNEENEVILLVDMSDTTEEEAAIRDALVRDIIDVCDDGCGLGIVKFGYGHNYSVPITKDKSGLYEKYISSENPDGSATALADALKYSASLFDHKESSKIVVISDGFETDGNALLVLNEILAQGTVVDAVAVPSEQIQDIQIVDAQIRDTEIVVGESFTVDVFLKCNSVPSEDVAVLRLYDNGNLYGEVPVPIQNGDIEFAASLVIYEYGMHELNFELVTDYELFGEPLPDSLKVNNSYRTFVNLEEMENVLLIERYEGEGALLADIVSETKTVTDISVEEDIDMFPTSISEMAEYEQIILVNIAYSDMPAGFEELLNRYVYDLGGGLFTVGGKNDYSSSGSLIPHAYNREDLESSKYYKNMLPVNAEDYTPPIAVMLVVDTSLSMKSTGKLDAAIDGAKACLDALHDRDFCGIVSFSGASSERLSILPVSQKETITEAINKIKDDGGGGTIFSDAIMKAGRALSVINNVERKHIILITDGLPGDSYDEYKQYIEDNVADNITMSVLTIGIEDARKEAEMQKAATEGGGKFYNVNDIGSISNMMYRDLTEEAIPEIQYGKKFELAVKDKSSIFTGIEIDAIPTLSGYYGTVAKKEASVPLMGEYVPIYAMHRYGNGKVGSFMCDLNGEWSAEFVESVVGRALILNIVESIFPSTDLRADDIRYELKSDNYTHSINIHGAKEGQVVDVTVNPVSYHLQHLNGVIAVDAAESNSRFVFKITEPGLYEIIVSIKDENGALITEIPLYKSFSYSEEYDTFSYDVDSGEEFMTSIADVGEGTVVSDPIDVFVGFADKLVMEYDPKVILIIASIVLVLLDIAVRKFKIKWIHEIIRERKYDNQ